MHSGTENAVMQKIINKDNVFHENDDYDTKRVLLI